ncbi:RAMP superfamily protein [Clostridium acetireducens DSM 10703]|uniref:RAMP superfamily protein n=1 Tax=Clostridium acetireducens DSM 10703 TaxID=1121290 RepID=A0A1E8F0T6_9CLOT|nr:CRISPR-associated RAMP protein Csx7 [Clostridium acetireducens]OFI07063.1 RAMP superfamily protein [Clostridium acetireducens DSM 10703]
MFSNLINEAQIECILETRSPLFIKSGEEDPLNPTAADDSYIAFYKEGKMIPVIPGTGLKGVFRSRAEVFLKKYGICNIFSYNNSCGKKIADKQKKNKNITGIDKYDLSCAVCKLFGSQGLKSRISFEDFYPIENPVIGKRKGVAIDRISGAARKGAFYDFEYVEYGKFKGKIKIKNFFPWNLKLILLILEDINEGFVTLGGVTSKGFGQMEVKDINMKIRYYDKSKNNGKYEDKGFYIERKIDEKEVKNIFSKIKIDETEVKTQGSDLKNGKVL